MSVEITNVFKKKRGEIIELWIKNQLADAGLREDLMSNEDLRVESEELINALINALNERNLDNADSSDFDHVAEILGGISISRAQQGYSPRETGLFVMSLKEALLTVMK